MQLSHLKTSGGRNKNRKTVKKTGKVSWIKFVTNHYYQHSKKNKKWTFKDSLKQSKKIWGKSQKNNIKKGGASPEDSPPVEPSPSLEPSPPAEPSPPSDTSFPDEPSAEPSPESPPAVPSLEPSNQVLNGGKKKKSRSKR